MANSRGGSVSPAYFDGLYAADPDPWGFTTSPYEAEKYAATLAVLPRGRYTSALEIGCSIGVFTRLLAARCDAVLAVDASERALSLAKERCQDLPSVNFRQVQVPSEFPGDRFDLIVLSEVGYYLSRADLLHTRQHMLTALAPSGHLLLVHWTPPIDDAPLTGDEVHDCFAAAGRTLTCIEGRRFDTYRIDLFEHREPGHFTSEKV